MHSIIVINDKLTDSTKAALDKYSKYFSKAFFCHETSVIDALKAHEVVLKKQEAFFVIDTNMLTLTDAQWRNIIIQSSLNTPIIFVRKHKIRETVVYRNRLKNDLRGIFEAPEILTPSGVYILNHKIFKFLNNSLDMSIKAWLEKSRQKNAKKSSNILVYILPEDADE